MKFSQFLVPSLLSLFMMTAQGSWKHHRSEFSKSSPSSKQKISKLHNFSIKHSKKNPEYPYKIHIPNGRQLYVVSDAGTVTKLQDFVKNSPQSYVETDNNEIIVYSLNKK